MKILFCGGRDYKNKIWFTMRELCKCFYSTKGGMIGQSCKDYDFKHPLYCYTTKILCGLLKIHWHKGGRSEYWRYTLQNYSHEKSIPQFKENRIRSIKIIGLPHWYPKGIILIGYPL